MHFTFCLIIIINVSYITPYYHTDVGCNYHWYYLSPNIMAKAFDESFNTVEELEISQIGEHASVPNFDNVTTCSCRGNCIWERGRNFCPCKSCSEPV